MHCHDDVEAFNHNGEITVGRKLIIRTFRVHYGKV